MSDAWEEVPQHQKAEDLRSLAKEGYEQVFGSGDFECPGQAQEEEIAVLILPSDLEAFITRAHNGEEPLAIMLEIYANTFEVEIELEDGCD